MSAYLFLLGVGALREAARTLPRPPGGGRVPGPSPLVAVAGQLERLRHALLRRRHRPQALGRHRRPLRVRRHFTTSGVANQ